MKIKFDVTTQELAIIRQVLESTLPAHCKVWVFGSRAKNQAKYNSDLDLAIECAEALDKTTLMQLETQFDESRLPYRVDIVDLNKAEPYFKEIVEQQKVKFPFKNNIPELRFSDFISEWCKVTIDEVSHVVTSGSRDWAQYYSTDGAKFIRMTNLSRNHIHLLLDDLKFVRLPNQGSEGERTSLKSDDILISITAELGKIGLVPQDIGEAYINQHTALVRPDISKMVPSFFAYKLSTRAANKRLNRLNDSGAKSGLNLKTIKDFNFLKPEAKEQQKIATFLSTVDKKLNMLRRKHALLGTSKRGLMQKIFSQEIRFKQDDGSDFPDWEKKGLKDLAERRVLKNSDNGISRVLTNSATQGILDQQDYFDKDIANGNNLDGYYVVDKGDYVYNPRISVYAPVGPINKNKIGQGLMSPLYSIFRFRCENNEFFEKYFQTTCWHRYMCSVANFGARHDRMNITMADFMAMPLPCPHPEEQQKIANCLTAFDQKIDAVAQQITQLETFKQGLLQQMFV